MKNNSLYITLALPLITLIISCKKIIQISPPVGTITTSQVFSTDDQATSAITGIYYQMINSNQCLSNLALSIYGGMSADELAPFIKTNANVTQFQQNNLVSTNSYISTAFWNFSYSMIYSANAVIEGVTSSPNIHDSVKNELIGEAEFIRGFFNFYLTNLFGPIPLVNTINWRNTNLLSRSDSSQVYQQIIADLIDAQKRLASDYSVGQGQRIVPNKWAATALLARVYLYMKDWTNAEEQSTSVINNSNLFTLVNDLNGVFLTNSSEAIWQLQQTNSVGTYNATPEAALLIPLKLNSNAPFAYLTPQLLNAFDSGDQRRIKWIDSTSYSGVKYYIPYKYKFGKSQAAPGGAYTEYYMVLRLAEQYLIRAEARIQQNKLSDGASDLNVIRNRAGLPDTTSSSQTDLLTLVAHERQIEFFVEWGHRWLDLKRTNQASSILSPIKSAWTNNAELYPIPRGEITTDPNLTQNQGYPY